MKKQPPLCGGIVDRSDFSAPKKILSDKITGFYARFFLWGDLPGQDGKLYEYETVRNDDGTFTLTDLEDKACVVKVDRVFFDDVQKTVVKHGLVQYNGKDKHTAGLPVPYQPCCLHVQYDSGEELYFSFNNNPEAEWAKDLLCAVKKALTN